MDNEFERELAVMGVIISHTPREGGGYYERIVPECDMRLSLLRETPRGGFDLKQIAPGWGLITDEMSTLRGSIKGQMRGRLCQMCGPVMISRVLIPPLCPRGGVSRNNDRPVH